MLHPRPRVPIAGSRADLPRDIEFESDDYDQRFNVKCTAAVHVDLVPLPASTKEFVGHVHRVAFELYGAGADR